MGFPELENVYNAPTHKEPLAACPLLGFFSPRLMVRAEHAIEGPLNVCPIERHPAPRYKSKL